MTGCGCYLRYGVSQWARMIHVYPYYRVIVVTHSKASGVFLSMRAQLDSHPWSSLSEFAYGHRKGILR